MSNQDMSRAAQAAELLENPLIIEALAAFEKEITESWKKSPARDQEGREKLFWMLQAQEKFKAHLQTMVNTGKLLSLQPTPTERLRRVVGLS
jgi:hypothetical protein